MCFKYATPKLEEMIEYLGEQPKYTIQDYYEYYLADGFEHRYMPVTTKESPGKIEKAIWGLVPDWVNTSPQAKEIADMTLNAKSETIYEKASFKNYIGSQRCLVWTNGFFEHRWEDPKGKVKTPYFIYMKDKKPFCFGGLYSHWARPDSGELLTTFSIITTEANSLMAEIHNNKKRMPLVLTNDMQDIWLGDLDKEGIKSMMQPLPDGILTAHTISKLITNFKEDRNVPEVQAVYDYPMDSLF